MRRPSRGLRGSSHLSHRVRNWRSRRDSDGIRCLQDAVQNPACVASASASVVSNARLFRTIRWLLLIPSAIAAWYLAAFVSVLLYAVVIMPCRASDTPLPQFCQASWFPLEFLDHAIVFFGVGLSAVLVVLVAAVVAPFRKAAVAWVALATGAIVAIVMVYGTDGVAAAEAVVAIASGALTAVLVSRVTIGSRHAEVATTDVGRR